jgi:hypothetical protein
MLEGARVPERGARVAEARKSVKRDLLWGKRDLV